MKQWLAQGSGSIYQLCKAFRQDPVGRLHQPEFTLLEWYREGFDLEQLIFDVAALIGRVIGKRPLDQLSYRDAFLQYLDLDIFSCSDEAIVTKARALIDVSFEYAERDVWLDLLLTHYIEPQLGRNGFTFLYHYPPSQAALATVTHDDHGNAVARRFELYIEGIEIANGYHELVDAEEFQRRYAQDNKDRVAMGKAEVAMDKDFFRAMENGVPDCSGVALGVDRLLLFLANDS
jgi:lysyl-tRNA synthetase class 2